MSCARLGCVLEVGDTSNGSILPTLYSDQNDKVVIAAKLVVYAGEPEEYYSFLSPEAYSVLKDWMDFREADGEKVTGESWVMRDLWPTKNVKRASKGGLASHPRRLKDAGIKKLLNRALTEQHIRLALPEGERRHEFKTSHGYRKFFKTRAEGVMKPLNVELLMGHNSGISESYYRPTEKEVLEDYLKVVPYLTINNDQKVAVQLQKQVAELTEKNEQENHTILGKLAEKEKETEAIKKQLAELQAKDKEIEDMAQSLLKLKSKDVEAYLRKEFQDIVKDTAAIKRIMKK